MPARRAEQLGAGLRARWAIWPAASPRSSNQQIDSDVGALQRQTDRARRELFLESTLLLPLVLIVVLLFALRLSRPLRQIDRAIGELGRGNFSQRVVVGGPVDLERLGHQLEWLRNRLLELAQERNRFLRHMSHELKTPLANIREGTELLMDGAVGELDSGQREVTEILRDNGIKLQRLIENLLELQRLAEQQHRPGGVRVSAAARGQAGAGEPAADAGVAAGAARCA